MINESNTWPLDKTRKVAELDRAELDALAASVKAILQSDKQPAGALRIKEVPLDARMLGILMPPTV